MDWIIKILVTSILTMAFLTECGDYERKCNAGNLREVLKNLDDFLSKSGVIYSKISTKNKKNICIRIEEKIENNKEIKFKTKCIFDNENFYNRDVIGEVFLSCLIEHYKSSSRPIGKESIQKIKELFLQELKIIKCKHEKFNRMLDSYDAAKLGKSLSIQFPFGPLNGTHNVNNYICPNNWERSKDILTIEGLVLGKQISTDSLEANLTFIVTNLSHYPTAILARRVNIGDTIELDLSVSHRLLNQRKRFYPNDQIKD